MSYASRTCTCRGPAFLRRRAGPLPQSGNEKVRGFRQRLACLLPSIPRPTASMFERPRNTFRRQDKIEIAEAVAGFIHAVSVQANEKEIRCRSAPDEGWLSAACSRALGAAPRVGQYAHPCRRVADSALTRH